LLSVCFPHFVGRTTNKADEIADGLFDILKEAGRNRDSAGDRVKKDNTRTFRRRGLDGREL